MTTVKIAKNKIYVGSKAIPLVAGEVHYWRLNPIAWKEILLRVKEMGVQVISTYVPWDYHEPNRGVFDFTGKTDRTRDLKAFLDLTRKMGFWVIIRPGPYIYSEWPQDGVPPYAHQYHRLHPQFIKYAKVWMSKVCAVIKPYLATRKGGHIFLFQADNEVDPWPDLFGAQYGLSGKKGLFQEFVRELYQGRLFDLNQAWGTAYRSFDEAAPFMATMLSGETGLPLKGDQELRRHLDYFRFKYDYTAKIARWTVAEYKRLGINVPIYLNTYPFFYAHDWSDLQKECDTIGIDLYPTSELAEDKHEFRKYCDKIRYLGNVSKLPFIAEFQSGIWHGRHYEVNVLTGSHYRMITLAALLAGIKGWSWYMLVNRDNWYMSPINEWGRVRGELYDVFKQLVALFKRMDPTTLEKIVDIGVTFNPLQYAARTLPGDSPILTALNQTGMDYDLCDPRAKIPSRKVLFYWGNQWLDEASQKRLKEYVEQGGTIVAFRDFPRKDENFKPCQTIGFEEPERTLFEFKKPFELKLSKKGESVRIVSSVYTFKADGAQKIEVDVANHGKLTVGYIKKIGKGKIVHLGMEPGQDLIQLVLKHLGVLPASYSTTSEIHTALFKRAKKHYVVVVNNGREQKTAALQLPGILLKRKAIVTDLLTGQKLPVKFEPGQSLSVEIARKDGTVLEIA